MYIHIRIRTHVYICLEITYICVCVCVCVCVDVCMCVSKLYVRCLLITESPKTPSHYRYQIWVLCYIPYTGLAVFSLRFLVFLCILRF